MELTLQALADRAGVDEDYAQRLVEMGALERRGAYGDRDVHLVALLHAWDRAGLPPDDVLGAARRGELSFSFLETPGWELPERLDTTYRELAEREGIPLPLLLALHEALGFEPPEPDDRPTQDDVAYARLTGTLLGAGASEEDVRRLFRLYADNLSRLARGEADLYRSGPQRRMEESGTAEEELMRAGSRLGRVIGPSVARTLLAVYERHRQHVWTEASVLRAEAALERAGLRPPSPHAPAICFVDLTGYTALTEERGDEEAAHVATALAELIQAVSRRYGGRPVRWLGDGGMFLFGSADATARAALEVIEAAPRAGLPPTHIGIDSGPVVFQDGDVYGGTVNTASRIAARAAGGEVLMTERAARDVGDPAIHLEPLRPVALKGIDRPVAIYRAAPRGR